MYEKIMPGRIKNRKSCEFKPAYNRFAANPLKSDFPRAARKLLFLLIRIPRDRRHIERTSLLVCPWKEGFPRKLEKQPCLWSNNCEVISQKHTIKQAMYFLTP